MRTVYSRLLVGCLLFFNYVTVFATEQKIAFEIDGNKTSMQDLQKAEKARFFKIEKEKYSLISSVAEEQYLEYFWKKEANRLKISSEEAKKRYLLSRLKVNNSEVQEILSKYRDHPKLKNLSNQEKKKIVHDQIVLREEQQIIAKILSSALRSGSLKVIYPRPVEPLIHMDISEDDPVRFGPKPSQINPLPGGCKADDCLITLVEVSELECPYCAQAIPATLKIMDKYAGKIRWVMKDFPLSFHKNAKPAAVAARCAGEQGKFWEIYELMFRNQRALSQNDITKYGKQIGLNEEKFAVCRQNPSKYLKIIERNIRQASKAGVTGTPTFLINGQKFVGPRSFDEYDRIISGILAQKRN